MSQLLNAVTTTGAGAGVPPFTAHVITACQCTVAGSGSVSATVNLEGSNDGTNWAVVAIFTLSGTTSASDATTFYTAFCLYRGNVTAISGTSAAVTMGMGV